MLPIVLFIISLNLLLSLACLWMVWTILQWRKRLIQFDRTLTIVQHRVHSNLPVTITNSSLTVLQHQYQQLNQSLRPQFASIFQVISGLSQLQRLSLLIGKRNKNRSLMDQNNDRNRSVFSKSPSRHDR